jgi:hypothetical protein
MACWVVVVADGRVVVDGHIVVVPVDRHVVVVDGHVEVPVDVCGVGQRVKVGRDGGDVVDTSR